MKTQIISGRIDSINLSREMSRERFVAMPKEKRIADKRRKAPRYRPDWRRDQ